MDEGSPDVVANVIRARAAIDPGYIARLMQIESGGDPNAVTGRYRGLFQLGPNEEARYGINDANRTDRGAQTAAVTALTQTNAAALRRALGREPTHGELYLAHQQGVAGAPALLGADPNMPAWKVIRPFYGSDAIAQKAIMGNLPSSMRSASPDAITAGTFRDLWINKFERGGTRAQPPALGAAPVSGAMTTGAGAVGPSQTGAVPVAPQNAAGADDELLRTLQTLTTPAETMPSPQPLRLNVQEPPGVRRARRLAAAMIASPVV